MIVCTRYRFCHGILLGTTLQYAASCLSRHKAIVKASLRGHLEAASVAHEACVPAFSSLCVMVGW